MNRKHSKQCKLNIMHDLNEDLQVSAVVIASSLHKASCRSSSATHPPLEKALSTVEVRRLHCSAYIPSTPPSLHNFVFAPLGASTSCKTIMKRINFTSRALSKKRREVGKERERLVQVQQRMNGPSPGILPKMRYIGLYRYRSVRTQKVDFQLLRVRLLSFWVIWIRISDPRSVMSGSCTSKEPVNPLWSWIHQFL